MILLQRKIRCRSGMRLSLVLAFILFFSACGKLDPERIARIETSWEKALGGSRSEYTSNIIQTDDGSYLVAGNSYSQDGDVQGNNGAQDAWVLKITSTGEIVWQYAFGGSSYDEALALLQMSSGTFLVAGATGSLDGDVEPAIRIGNSDQQDIWMIRLDAYGQILDQHCFGGSGTEWIRDIQETGDGGYILAATSNSSDIQLDHNHGGVDFWIVKLNASLDIEWQKSYGGSVYDDAYCIQQTPDGGYIVCGDTGSADEDVSGFHGWVDGWILKLDVNGNIEWKKCYGGSRTEWFHHIITTADGGYAVAGASESNNGDVMSDTEKWKAWILKLNQSGDILWQKCIGSPGGTWSHSILELEDGSFMVFCDQEAEGGDVTENYGGTDWWIVKLTPEGELDWEKSLGGSGIDYARCMIRTRDSQYLLAGDVESNDGDFVGNHGEKDIWLLKFRWFK